MDRYQGTIVENSLISKDVLKEFEILKTWRSGNWILHDVAVREDQLPQLAGSLSDGPWYIHLWRPNSNDIIVLFKQRTFRIDGSNKSTWSDAISFGKSIGIPEKQLDFIIH